ncbi:MAG: hypothetical protein AAGF48_01760 [Pseudomonadota bacterium]
MKHALNGLSTLALAAAMAAFSGFSAVADVPLLVTSAEDSGEGTLRAALETAAKSDSLTQILIATDGDIEVGSTLTYAGTGPLAIHGKGQTIKTSVDTTLLNISQGADLTLIELNLEGPGNFSIENQGGTGKAIFVDVRDDQTGVVSFILDDVDISGFADYGVLISDCDIVDNCGAGRGGAGNGSDASILVRLNDVKIDDVGNGHFDADGLRVDERGPGDILFYAKDSAFTNAGADGIELDEGQEGSVFATAVDTRFDDNGEYCDPEILKSFLPSDAEGKFEDGEFKEADVPPAVTGSPDDGCFERDVELYESGSVKEYEISLDFDDGFDIDEAGPGDLWALIVDSSIKGNDDEGLDFGEEDEGNLKLGIWNVEATGNTDDGLKIVESGEGNLSALLSKLTSRDNGGYGADFRQIDEGALTVTVDRSRTSGNDDGEETGLRVDQRGSGEGTLRVSDSEFEDGIKANNVKVIEE